MARSTRPNANTLFLPDELVTQRVGENDDVAVTVTATITANTNAFGERIEAVHTNDETQNSVAGEVTTYHFDASNRLIESRQPDGSVTTYTYDASNITQNSVTNEVTTFYHDVSGRRIGFEQLDGSVTTYDYDAVGNEIGVRRNNRH